MLSGRTSYLCRKLSLACRHLLSGEWVFVNFTKLALRLIRRSQFFIACMQTNQHITVLYYAYVYNHGYTGLSHAIFTPRFKLCARLLFYVVVWSLVNASAPGLSLAGCHRFEPRPLPNTFHLYHLCFNVLVRSLFIKG